MEQTQHRQAAGHQGTSSCHNNLPILTFKRVTKMKKLLVFSMMLLSMAAVAQNNDGAQRRCGNEFAAYGLAGMTYVQALDYAGQTHNDYQDYILKELAARKADFTDTNVLKAVVFEKSALFFASKGLSFDPTTATLGLGKPVDFNFNISPKAYSPAAYNILKALEGLLKGYDATSDAAFFGQLAKLKQDALNLPNDTEVFVAGLPVTVAIYSFTYWKANGQYWVDVFTPYNGTAGKMVPAQGDALKAKCKVNLVNVGGSDVAGAVSGGVMGSLLGPGGALAGGVLNSATTSLGNLANQVIKCYASWWPF
jgi:hypothetical protein